MPNNRRNTIHPAGAGKGGRALLKVGIRSWIQLAALSAMLCSAQAEQKPARVVGVKLGMPPESASLVGELADAKVNSVFISARKMGSDEFMIACRKHGIAVFAILPVFVDAPAVLEDPGLSQINALGEPLSAGRKFYRPVCPNRADYRIQKIQELEEFLRQHPVDGLSLDFIRYGVEWEKILPGDHPGLDQEFCFCPVCLEKFSDAYDVTLPSRIADAAALILEEHQAEWTEFKCATIASMVEEIRIAAERIVPGIRIAIHALPWTKDDYQDGARRLGGQDFALLAPLVDIFSPMNYHFMLYREPQSIQEQVNELAGLGPLVVPCIQGGIIFRKEEPFPKQEFEAALASALEPPSDGINLYTWKILRESPELLQMWKSKLRASGIGRSRSQSTKTGIRVTNQ